MDRIVGTDWQMTLQMLFSSLPTLLSLILQIIIVVYFIKIAKKAITALDIYIKNSKNKKDG